MRRTHDQPDIFTFFGGGNDDSTPRRLFAQQSTRERFEEFHRLNPHVYVMLLDLALRLVRGGRRHLSFRMIWETLRCDLMLRTTSDDEFKLNDHFAPYYSRMLMEREAELRGVFETRERGGAE